MAGKSRESAPRGADSLLNKSYRAPLEEPGCIVVDVVKELLVAATRGQEEFAHACAKYGLTQYGTKLPSDLGIINFLQPLTDCAFHSRKHRELEAQFRSQQVYREEMQANEEARKKTEKHTEIMDAVNKRMNAGTVSQPITGGLFDE